MVQRRGAVHMDASYSSGKSGGYLWSSPSTLIIKSTGSWPLLVSITRATKDEFKYTNFESTSHWTVNPDGETWWKASPRGHLPRGVL